MKNKKKDEMRKEYDFSKGQRGRYASRIGKGDTDLKNVKVRVTLYLDGDVVEYFKRRASEPNAAPYQTQINSELRRIMEAEPGIPRYRELVENDAFISAVAERLARRLA
ncbi:MAG TPA: BrnA antitoxin family protein [Blastocatellia bacterium]|nr:BrnA antitoxin family protein [Blastocatellia bacterium]